jgi:hypothetical protein
MSASNNIATSIPLTTTFKPSPSCLSDYYWTGSFLSLGPPVTSDCLPPGWQVISQHFSPGLCPSGYVIACSTTTILGTFTETQATCCPSSYSCQTEDFYAWFSTEPCARNFNAFPTSSTLTITTIVGGATTSFSSVLSGGVYGGVNAYGISIRWQSTDFQTTSTYPATITLTVIITPTITITANEITSLSPGAAAGISVSVTLIFVAIVSAVIFFILRRRRRSKLESMTFLQREPARYRPQELDNTNAQHELHGENRTQMIAMDGGMVHSDEGAGGRFVELSDQAQGSGPH